MQKSMISWYNTSRVANLQFAMLKPFEAVEVGHFWNLREKTTTAPDWRWLLTWNVQRSGTDKIKPQKWYIHYICTWMRRNMGLSWRHVSLNGGVRIYSYLPCSRDMDFWLVFLCCISHVVTSCLMFASDINFWSLTRPVTFQVESQNYGWISNWPG